MGSGYFCGLIENTRPPLFHMIQGIAKLFYGKILPAPM
jgi:hypothetical protein